MKRNKILAPILGSILVVALFFAGKSNKSDYFEDNVGIQLYSLRNQFKKDIPSTLEKIKEWGITVIEGGDSYGMEQSKFIELLEKNGLKTVSVGASFEEFKDKPEEIVEKAKAYGAKYAMCAWIPHDGDNFTLEDIENATKVFNNAGKILKENGITLIYHAHGYEFRPFDDGTLFDVMAENAENFDFEMDVYWVKHGGQDPMALLEKYADKWKAMHLKDMAHGTEGNYTGHSDVETNVELGTGMIDIEGLVKRGKELGVEYMFIEDESSSVVEQVPPSLAYLEKILK